MDKFRCWRLIIRRGCPIDEDKIDFIWAVLWGKKRENQLVWNAFIHRSSYDTPIHLRFTFAHNSQENTFPELSAVQGRQISSFGPHPLNGKFKVRRECLNELSWMFRIIPFHSLSQIYSFIPILSAIEKFHLYSQYILFLDLLSQNTIKEFSHWLSVKSTRKNWALQKSYLRRLVWIVIKISFYLIESMN